MKTTKIILGTLFASIMLSSCYQGEVPEPTPPPAPIVVERELTFVESLELFYYGEVINIWDNSHDAVGADGSVEYEIWQPDVRS